MAHHYTAVLRALAVLLGACLLIGAAGVATARVAADAGTPTAGITPTTTTLDPGDDCLPEDDCVRGGGSIQPLGPDEPLPPGLPDGELQVCPDPLPTEVTPPSDALYTMRIHCVTAEPGPTPSTIIQGTGLAAQQVQQEKKVTIGWAQSRYTTMKRRNDFFIDHDYQDITTSEKVVSLQVGVNSVCTQPVLGGGAPNERKFSHTEFNRVGQLSLFTSDRLLWWRVREGVQINCTVTGIGGFVQIAEPFGSVLAYGVEFTGKSNQVYTPSG
jgi:hypothetical protein